MSGTTFELVLGAACIAVAVLAPKRGARAFARLARGLDALASRPALAALLCAAVAGVGSAAIAALVQWPAPVVHDEASYLLGADTFAHGRLANPSPSHPPFFETIHVLVEPSYASKYPPGQSLALALGQVLAGTPAAGLWLQAAALGAALAWMLRAWQPSRWALLAALLVTLRLGVATYWTQSYWGGALAATGGALVWGAVPRLRSAPRLRDGFWLGLGLATLALTRPYEGLVASVPAGLALLPRLRSCRLALVPTALVLAAGAAFVLAHNRATTGDPLRMPYQEHDAQYAVAPPFLFLEEAPLPEYRHEVIRENWTGRNLDQHRERRTWPGFLRATRETALVYGTFYLGGVLVLVVLGLPRTLGDRRARTAIALGGLGALAILVETYRMIHYAAPFLGLLGVVVAASLRGLAHGDRGRALVAAIALATCVVPLHQASRLPRPDDAWERVRADIEQQLVERGGRHLVFVRYGETHPYDQEWVYNGADLEDAAVLWARDLGDRRNQLLLADHPDRTPHRVFVGIDVPEGRLLEYATR